MYESLGLYEGGLLYNEDFEYINVKAEIGQQFYVTIIVLLMLRSKKLLSFGKEMQVEDVYFLWEKWILITKKKIVSKKEKMGQMLYI